MKIGFVGLGKMGGPIVTKLLAAQTEVVVYDVNTEAVNALVTKGAIGASSHEDLVAKLGENPVVWFMVPLQFVEEIVAKYYAILQAGALLIDGGNTNYVQTLEHAKVLATKNIDLVDAGTSGGILGLEHGFSFMVGGSVENYNRIEPLLTILTVPNGSTGHMGATGSGHYTKMVHNGVEYGVMQALAEGYELLNNGPVQPIPLAEVARVWQHGSIIESTLNGLVEEILNEDPKLDSVDGYVADTGEGRWTLETAHNANVNVPALEAAINVRKESQAGKVSYGTKLLAAMRNKFGGHAINKQS